MAQVISQAIVDAPGKSGKLQRWLLGLPLVLLPLSVAGVRPIAWGGIAGVFLVGTTVLLWTDSGVELFPRVWGRWGMLLGCLLLYPLLQVLPLPTGLLGLLDPQRVNWIDAAAVTGRPDSFAGISYVPLQTVVEDFRWIFLLVFALMLRKAWREERSVDWLFILLFCVGTFEALYGLLQVLIPSLGGVGGPLGIKGVARGTFVNRNNYACLLGMIWPLLLGYVLGLNMPASGKSATSYHERERGQQMRQRQWFLGLLIGLMLLALFFSRSRGGILSSLVALTVFVAVGRVRGKGMPALVIGSWLVMLAYGSIIGFSNILMRFDRISESAPSRFKIWGEAWHMARDHWLTGIGLGSFGRVYMVYQHHLSDTLTASFTHNDYLQLAVELGVPVAVGVILVAWGYWWRMALKQRRELMGEGRGTREKSRLITVGALAGSAAFLAHGWVEFNWEIPADALYFVMLLVIMRGEKSRGERRGGDAHSS